MHKRILISGKNIAIRGKDIAMYGSLHGHPNRPQYRPNAVLRGGTVFLPFATAGLTINERKQR